MDIMIWYLASLLNLVLIAEASTYKWGREVSGEYCDYETFKAQCPGDASIIIGRAAYGHIEQAKCIKFNTGHFGCKTDVTSILDSKCSGKKQCSIPVQDESLRSTAPCTPGISLYLDASYVCANDVYSGSSCSGIQATETITYITSTQAKKSICTHSTGLYDQEFSLTAKPGQHISFTLVDIAVAVQKNNQGLTTQDELGYILDTTSEEVLPIRRKGMVESEEGQVKGHTASIVLSSNPSSNFLIGFKATGCADLQLRSDVKVTREDNIATVSCFNSPQTWHLTCQNGHWLGVIGNCSLPAAKALETQEQPEADLPLPRDMIFIIIGCATFFLAIVVVTFGYVCLKWPKQRKQAETGTLRYAHARPQRVPSTAGPDTVYLMPGFGTDNDNNADYQPIWEKPLPRPPGDGQASGSTRQGTVKRNNEEAYTASLSSNSTDYERKKYYVLDKDYMDTMGVALN